MLSYPPAAGAAPTAHLDDEEGAPEEERYLDYFGYEDCPGEIHIRIDTTSEGATADVAGMVPFKQADTADYRGKEHDLTMQCLGSRLLYDLKARKIYIDDIGHPGPRGSYRYWDGMRLAAPAPRCRSRVQTPTPHPQEMAPRSAVKSKSA